MYVCILVFETTVVHNRFSGLMLGLTPTGMSDRLLQRPDGAD